MKGKIKRGRQKKRWEDNIKEGRGMDLTGKDGKGMLRIHLWCPDDLPRLWDRIEWIETDLRETYQQTIIHLS